MKAFATLNKSLQTALDMDERALRFGPDSRTIMHKPRPPTPQDCTGLSGQREGRVISGGNCDGNAYDAVNQRPRNRDRPGTGGEHDHEQPSSTRGRRYGKRQQLDRKAANRDA